MMRGVLALEKMGALLRLEDCGEGMKVPLQSWPFAWTVFCNG